MQRDVRYRRRRLRGRMARRRRRDRQRERRRRLLQDGRNGQLSCLLHMLCVWYPEALPGLPKMLRKARASRRSRQASVSPSLSIEQRPKSSQPLDLVLLARRTQHKRPFRSDHSKRMLLALFPVFAILAFPLLGVLVFAVSEFPLISITGIGGSTLG
jgi:hypothetical protein